MASAAIGRTYDICILTVGAGRSISLAVYHRGTDAISPAERRGGTPSI